MFTLMKDMDGITPELLARILTHVFPDYQQVQEHTTNWS